MKNYILLTVIFFLARPVLGKWVLMYPESPYNGLAPMGIGGWQNVLLNGGTSEIRFYQVKNEDPMYDTFKRITENGYRTIKNNTIVFSVFQNHLNNRHFG